MWQWLRKILGIDAANEPPPSDDESADDEEAEDFSQAVAMPITDELDLHGFAPKEVYGVVVEYLREAAARGFAEVRIVHGKGQGVQRRMVQAELARNPLVVSFRDAPVTQGGLGATLARLKKPHKGSK